MSTNRSNGFGRDEMNALLGGGLPERLVRQQLPAAPVPGGSTKKKGKDDQVSDMTPAETAAWLLKQQKEKSQGGVAAQVAPKVQRHRAARVRQYHQLLQEEVQREAVNSNDNEELVPSESKPEQPDEEEEFASPSQQQSRTKVEPVVLRKRRRRRDSSSSSSSSSESDEDSASGVQLRNKPEETSSDSDDSAADRRRQRLIQRRAKALDNRETRETQIAPKGLESEECAGSDEKLVEKVSNSQVTNFEKRVEKSSGESSASGATSIESESESSEEEETSSESDNESVPKPVFIPKHKRGTIQALVEKEAEEAAMAAKEQALIEMRKKESRAMVQEVLTSSARAAPDLESAFEGITGAENEVPDDTDREDELAVERERWEVRELMRLINDIDEERRRKEEERELERRRQMTDEERLQEDIDAGRYKRPGETRDNDKGRSASRYLHRGAFYMDESEWDESDIRRKAAEYARAPTVEDTIDRQTLPKVMQVKKFGFANQSKYKGLAAEDTTDKRLEMLPLLNQQNRKKSF